jgi:hypothetical protein
VDVLSSVAGTVGGAAALVDAGALRRVARAVASAPAYAAHEDSAVKVCNLFAVAARSGGEPLAAELRELRAPEVVLSAMTAHATSERVLSAGGAALQALGAGEEAAARALEQVVAANARLTTADDAPALAALRDALPHLSNLIVVRGVVTTATAGPLLDAVAHS